MTLEEKRIRNREYLRRWRESDPERAKASRKASFKKYYEKIKANPQKYKAYLRRYREYERQRRLVEKLALPRIEEIPVLLGEE